MSVSIDDIIEQKVKECVAAELEPFRSLLLHLSNSGETPVEPLVDAPEAARLSGYKQQTIRLWLCQGKVKNYGRPRSPRVRLSDILNLG